MTQAVVSTDGLAPISLAALNESAELLTRSERKYIVSPEMARQLLAEHDHLVVLDIDGRQAFGYESVYFDTLGWDLYRAAATGRRRRFKVRTRVYRDAGVATLEIKAKDGRGQTVKTRLDYHAEDQGRLTAEGQCFVDGLVRASGFASTLRPTLTTDYQRSTVVDLASGSRATLDHAVHCVDVEGRRVDVHGVIIETKSARPTCGLDRWLWRHGVRPVRISKYCTALAALHPDLPANSWSRTLNGGFVSPLPADI